MYCVIRPVGVRDCRSFQKVESNNSALWVFICFLSAQVNIVTIYCLLFGNIDILLSFYNRVVTSNHVIFFPQRPVLSLQSVVEGNWVQIFCFLIWGDLSEYCALLLYFFFWLLFYFDFLHLSAKMCTFYYSNWKNLPLLLHLWHLSQCNNNK